MERRDEIEQREEEGGGLEGLGRVLLCCERPCPPYHRLTLVISSNIAAKKLFFGGLGLSMKEKKELPTDPKASCRK